MRSLASILLASTLVACSPSGAAPGPAKAPEGTAAQPAQTIVWVEDDFSGALAKARAEKKLLFVDAWAPWCHTCLSMKRFVLNDPSLRRDDFVFVALDTDRPEAAPFLAKHELRFWPTFFVIDPERDEELAQWPGSASVAELRQLLDEAALAKRGADPRAVKLVAARRAESSGDLAGAARSFEEVAAATRPEERLHTHALVGWIGALSAKGDAPACVALGMSRAGEVRGAGAPSDFVGELMRCTDKLPEPERARPRAFASARLAELVAKPPEGATVDDRADTLEMYAEALESGGDAVGAKRAHERRLALLEQAAKEARSPELAQTFDYARATSYVAVGRPEEAVKMLEARVREFPESYEPVARLASVLAKSSRYAEALPLARRAVSLAYGPRKLRYRALEAEILDKSGDRAGAVRALEAEAKGWEELPPGQASAAKLASARKRLADARRAASEGGRPSP